MQTSIIVPVYNEKSGLANSLKHVSSFLKKSAGSYEIIVVDDASNDGTEDVLKRVLRKGPKLRVFRFKKRRGKGASLSFAIRKSRGERILVMDADLSVPLGCSSVLLKDLDGFDIVVGSRRANGAITKRPFIRKLFSFGYNFLVNLLFSTGIRDHQCGFKAFRRTAVLPLLPKIKSVGFFWDTELIVKAKRNKLKIKEVPVEWSERESGASKINPLKVAKKMGGDLFELYFRPKN